MNDSIKSKFLHQSFYAIGGDKWNVEYKDGSERLYKHVDGAEGLAEMVNWDQVKVVDGEVMAYDV